jgi:hypothetical protein
MEGQETEPGATPQLHEVLLTLRFLNRPWVVTLGG